MDRNEYDLLLGKLAVHFNVLTKDKVAEALQRRRLVDESLDLAQFLVDEGYIPPEVREKLEKARLQYLEKNGLEPPAPGPAAPGPAAPEPPAPAAPEPPAPAPGPADDPEQTNPAFQLEPPRDDDAPLQLDPQEEEDSPLRIEPYKPLTPPEPVAPQPAAPEPAAPVATDLQVEPVAPASPEPAAPIPPTASEPAPPQSAAPEPVAPQPAAPQRKASAQPSGPVSMPASSPEHLLQFGSELTLDALLEQVRKHNASDLHLHTKAPIRARLAGRMVDAGPRLEPEQTRALILEILTDEQRELLDEHLQLDFSYELPGIGRFRANAYKQQNGFDAVFRAIPPDPPTLEELGLPADLERVVSFHQGIVLFTGPAGCGKSSTMAAIVRLLNSKRPDHIITVEDPIEYVHRSDQCLVNQRQVGPHTESFARALRAALREDPDIIAIGELRDLETIELALTAAETGHLVLGTLHTSSAIRTINRLLGVFPPEQQNQIRTMVSESLRAVVSQRLVPRADGEGRVAALEVLMNTRAIGNLIREKKTFQLQSQMQTGSQLGMRLLDNSLLELVKAGTITKEEARRNAEDPKRFA